MKKNSKLLIGISMLVLLLIAIIGLIIKMLQSGYEDRGDLQLGGLVCFSTLELEIVIVILFLFVLLGGGYMLMNRLDGKARLLENTLGVIGGMYLRVVRINCMDGSCVFIKDDENIAGRLFAGAEWIPFRDKLVEEIHPEDQEMYKNFSSLSNFERICMGSSSNTVCTYRRLRGGEYRWIRVILVPIRQKRYEHNILLCARDVEENVKAEEYRKVQMMENLQRAKESEAEKADFLKFVAHDLRIPMNAVSKMSELAQQALQKEDYSRAGYYMERVRGMAKYSGTMLDDIMRRGVLQEEHIGVNRSVFYIRKLLDGCREYAVAMNVPDVKFEMHISEGLQEKYKGDVTRLTQVLYCLLSNAYKFNRKGGSVILSAYGEEQSSVAEKVTFRVEDTGCGIGDEFLPELFDAFAREKQGSENESVGVGLGLAFAKSVSDALDASILVESNQGEGSIFTISLWLEYVDAEDVISNEQNISKPESLGKDRLSVLVVDDTELNLQIALELLEGSGYRVKGYLNGEEALEAFEKSAPGTFDVILADTKMPFVNGKELARRIRESEHPDSQKVLIVALEANYNESEFREASEQGVDAFIKKPFGIEGFNECIQANGR